MLEWLVPFSAFWVCAALYLGGFSLKFEGATAGWRHVMGVLDSFVAFLLVWGGLRAVLGGMDGVLLRIVIPTAATTLLLPVITRIGFRIMGVRISRAG